MSDPIYLTRPPRILTRPVPAGGAGLTEQQLAERVQSLSDGAFDAIRQVFWTAYADCEYDLTDPGLSDKQHHFAQGGLANLTEVLARLEALRTSGTDRTEA